MSQITVPQVASRKDREAFIKFPWQIYRDDPAWVKAKEASEKKAGGPLTVKDGIKSVFLKPTDYSPMK